MTDNSTLNLTFPEDDIALLTLNTPGKSVNILARSVLEELEAHLDQLDKHSDLAGLVIISGKPGNFIAGADLTEFVSDINEPDDKVMQIIHRGQQLFARLSVCPYVTVAAIHGICVGGGSELSIWCDRRVLVRDDKTKFGFPEVKLGLFPGWGGTARTPRMIGLSNALELVTGGDNIDAPTAWAMGLANDLIESPKQLMASAIHMVRSEQKSGNYLSDRKQWSEPISISETELGFLGATASAYIQGETKGHYPAPMAALEVMLGAAGVDLKTACQMEAEGFVDLFGSEVNQSLLNVFFLSDRNKKEQGADGTHPHNIESATVLGAGTMGQGIAAANLKRGIPVALGDRNLQVVAQGVQGVLKEASYNKKIKAPDALRAIELSPLLNGTVSDDELATSDIVIEAIFENLDAKRELYARLEPKLTEQAILCSNTSTIPISKLAEKLKYPERFCGLHFFNPVRRMPLVEVIRGEKTSEETIATAVAYAKHIGKSPIVVGDGPGFLVNRVLLPYMSEALLLLEEGADIKKIDRAATNFGMPMGPITLYDTIGLDISLHAGIVMQKAFPDRVLASKILPAMVEAKRLGKKNNQGFFDYVIDSKGRQKSQPSESAFGIIQQFRSSNSQTDFDLADRLFMPMLLEATRLLEDGIVDDPRDIDLGLIYGIGFPPFKGGLFFWADTIGTKALVKKLTPMSELGERYAPTQLLLEYAKSDRKFYDTARKSIS